MKIYVAVKEKFNEGKENFSWFLQEKMLLGLQQISDKKLIIIITHVHVPLQNIPIESRQREQEKTEKRLQKYVKLCSKQKVDSEILVHVAGNVAKGLVELIEIHKITKLVMGAASDRRYRRNMSVPKSQTACSVNLFAPQSCDIWFVCKGNMVSRREKPLYVSQTAERALLQSIIQLATSAKLLTLDVSLIATLLGSPVYTEEQTEQASDFLEFKELKRKYDDAMKEIETLHRKDGLVSIKLKKSKIGILTKFWSSARRNRAEMARTSTCRPDFSTLGLSTTNNQEIRNFTEFPKLEIEQATQNFNDALKIGEGGFGNVYKGQIRNTVVAVKKLNSEGLQGKNEFRQEVAILGRIRHPNIVTLIGACSEECTIIYEFLPNGSLADRLKCKSNTPPLSYRARTRIAIEICSALMFLHSSKPHSIVHGDLKPENILLDANLVSKLSDFGICRLLQQSTSSDTTFYHQTDKLKGTLPYMDPDYLNTNKLTRSSDVHSFGIVILQLVTGLRPNGIVDTVKKAVEKNAVQAIVDGSAGPWPSVQVSKLVGLGLRCCEIDPKNRPDLVGEVWVMLKSMMPEILEFDVDYGVQVPDYFICPITMNIMKDPHVAADGFTYEGKAIEDWFIAGNNTSPVTNAPLNNTDLIRNLSLRYDVEAWLQKHRCT